MEVRSYITYTAIIIGCILGIVITRTQLQPLLKSYDTLPSQSVSDLPPIPTRAMIGAIIISSNPAEHSMLVDLADPYMTDARVRALVTYDANTNFRGKKGEPHKMSTVDMTGLAKGDMYFLLINRSAGPLYAQSMFMTQYSL